MNQKSITITNLTPGSPTTVAPIAQPPPTTPEQAQAIKRVLRLLKLSQEEETE